jgi:SPP1 gp7 family putative phage head morphogenesis protein
VKHFMPMVEKAIGDTALIEPEFAPAIAKLAADFQFSSARSAGLSLRKRLPQLAREEKKELGLRANAFFSREAESMLTDKGRKQPIEAFETVFLRVISINTGNRSEKQATAVGATEYMWCSVGDERTCPECRGRDGKFFRYDDRIRIGFPGNCSSCSAENCRCRASPLLPGMTKAELRRLNASP